MTNKELYQLKETFLQEWPLSRIQQLRLEEYTNLDKTSFCYWLEAKTHDLGSIWGGSSYKFGIYKRKDITTTITVDNRMTDGEYAWFQKYGATKEEAFHTVKNIIIAIIQKAQNNLHDEIDTIDLGDAYKWKIAFLYSDFTVVNIFKNEALLEAARSLGYKEESKRYSDLNRFILSQKTKEQNYFDFTAKLLKKTFLAIDFKDIVDNFRTYIENTDSKLQGFTLNDKRKGDSYIWINDHANSIGKDGFCHYELITRKKHPKKVWVEIHFSKKKLFKNLLNDKLGSDFFWNNEHIKEELSLAYHQPIDFGDIAINEKIEAALLTFEENFGDLIRSTQLAVQSNIPIMKTPLNQILYGPPGTGKTHKLKNEYFSNYTLTENSISLDTHFEDVVTTLTWWQVIALALLEIGTSKVNEILENRWVAKKALLSESKNVRATLWGTLQKCTLLQIPKP